MCDNTPQNMTLINSFWHNLWQIPLWYHYEHDITMQMLMSKCTLHRRALQQLGMICMYTSLKSDWLTDSALLRYTHRWDKVWKVLWLSVSPGVGGCEWFSQSQFTALPRTNNNILQLTWLLIVWEFKKFAVQIFNAQLLERFTDHQRVVKVKLLKKFGSGL